MANENELRSLKHTTDVSASAQSCYDVVTDYEKYPDWMPEFKSARVLKRDGNVWDVEFAFNILLKKIAYSIRVTHTPEELRTHWTFLRGDIIDNTVGGWHFTDKGSGRTHIEYEAGVSVGIPLGKAIVNKVADILTGTTVPRLFKNLEKRAQDLDRRKKQQGN